MFAAIVKVSVAGVEGVIDPFAGVTSNHAGTFCCGAATVRNVELNAPDSCTVCANGTAPPCN